MDLILFPGFADTNVAKRQAIVTAATGYSIRPSGSDFVVDASDPRLLAGPDDFVHVTNKPWNLSTQSYESVARDYVHNFRSKEFDQIATAKIPRNIEIDSQYGLKSKIEEVKLRFFLSRGRGTEDALVNHVFPLFAGELNLDRCYGVRIDAVRMQQLQTVLKIPLLISEFGSSHAEKLVLQAKAMSSILPQPTEALSYLDGLLTFGSFSIALPVQETGSALYFRAKGLCHFSSLGLENNFEQLMIGLSPLVAHSAKRQEFLSKGLGDRGYEGMFAKAVFAVNRVQTFLHDPRNFLVANRIDGKKCIQAHSTFRLIMADLQTSNFTASPYLRLKMSLSMLDKISNLWKGLSGSGKDEGDIFLSLLSMRTADVVATILKDEFSDLSITSAKRVRRSVLESVRGIHGQIRASIGESATESDVLGALRTLRNASHGTFLKRGQFEQRFLSSSTAIPNELEAFVFFLVWAICLRPAEFLLRKP